MKTIGKKNSVNLFTLDQFKTKTAVLFGTNGNQNERQE
jgi:hypothetical protein